MRCDLHTCSFVTPRGRRCTSSITRFGVRQLCQAHSTQRVGEPESSSEEEDGLTGFLARAPDADRAPNPFQRPRDSTSPARLTAVLPSSFAEPPPEPLASPPRSRGISRSSASSSSSSQPGLVASHSRSLGPPSFHSDWKRVAPRHRERLFRYRSFDPSQGVFPQLVDRLEYHSQILEEQQGIIRDLAAALRSYHTGRSERD